MTSQEVRPGSTILTVFRTSAGDILVLVNGEYVVVEKVQHEILESPVKVYNFNVDGYHTYYVTESSVLVHNRCLDNHVYDSVKDSPNYRSDFVKVDGQTKSVTVKNKELLDELRKYGKDWKKVYQDGYIDGQKASLHYFKNKVGKVFDVKYKCGWSVL